MGYTLQQLQQMGATFGPPAAPPKPEDLYNSFNGSFANDPSKPDLGIGSKKPDLNFESSMADKLGVSKLGQGLATADRMGQGASGQQTSEVTQDTNTQSQGLPQQMALLGQLHDMVVKGVPATDPKRVQLENVIKQQAQGTKTQDTEAKIDPGTTLSDRDVIGSAVDTAGLALGGGELEGADAVEGAEGAKNLSTGEKAIEGAKTGAKVGGVLGASQGLGGGLQNDSEGAGQVALDTVEGGVGGAVGGGVLGAAVPAAIDGIKAGQEAINNIGTKTAEETVAANQQTALNAIKNPLSKDEQISAVKRGRLSPSSTKGIDPAIDYSPSKEDLFMSESLKPMVEDGRIKAPTNATNQERNILETGKEINTQVDQLRTGLQQSDATSQANAQKTKEFLENASPTEKANFYKSVGGEENVNAETKGRNKLTTKQLRQELGSVNVPDPVKNEPTMAKNVKSLNDAAAEIYKKIPDHQSEAILDLKQKFDDYVEDNYGKTFYDKGRNSDPFHKYVYSLRDKFSELMADRLPDGKLPSGTTLRDAFMNQHHLINAQDEMAAKFTREYPQGSKPSSRYLKAHPNVGRLLRRVAFGVGATAAGVPIATSLIRKVETGK